MWTNPLSRAVYQTHSEIRQAYPNVSFPREITDDNIASVGLAPVVATTPEYDPVTQTIEGTLPVMVDGQWLQQWTVRVLTPEELQARVPTTVTPRQARLALQQAGMLAAVEAWIAQADAATRIEWEFALEVRRDWPALLACGAALGLTEEQLDGLFAQAATL